MQLKQDKMNNKLNILEEKKNPLFKRTEIIASIETEITPKRTEIAEAFSKKLSVPLANIVVKNIFGSFGSKVFKINASIYNSQEAKEKIELKNSKVKKSETKPKEEKAK